ncbi:hypothetical protein M4L90_12220 [Staphylococcus equorum]|uniref:Uncharacterized protein n=1 Tax=Staphylococcus equorum TaxID=246432 RepID=A0A9X4L5Z1_9STAP|nr:hypothetical protein [Staphylococcus equorum]MDG0820685.1 hypothetical protein [Staphylococcus equorum]MDG0841310.1 hypothetical protein [Staphylococcus equorum]MDG0847010.1 hypothetical protein [Staphylococcus equorum]PTE82286.1 hypothetical protein BUY85_00685 [Staphylococcus equorum]
MSKAKNFLQKKVINLLNTLILVNLLLLLAYGVFFEKLTWWQHGIFLLIISVLLVITIIKLFLKIDFDVKHEMTKIFVAIEFIIFLIALIVMVVLMVNIEVKTFQIISSATLTIMSLILVTSIDTIFETYILSKKYISQKHYDKYYRKDARTVRFSGMLLLFYLLTANLTIITMNTFDEKLWESYETLDSEKSHIEVKQDSKGQRYIDKSQTTFYLKSGDKVEIK